MGVDFSVKALIVVIMGGVGNMLGCLAAGLLLGVTESFTARFLDSGLKLAVAYLMFLAILLVQATGPVRIELMHAGVPYHRGLAGGGGGCIRRACLRANCSVRLLAVVPDQCALLHRARYRMAYFFRPYALFFACRRRLFRDRELCGRRVSYGSIAAHALSRSPAVSASVLALVVGLTTLRVSGVHFVIFTFGLTELIRELAIWWEINQTKTVGRYVLIDFSNLMIYLHLLALTAVVVLGSPI